MSYGWGSDDDRIRRRDRAVQDVLGGMSMIGAAHIWHVPVHDLTRWVDSARAGGKGES